MNFINSKPQEFKYCIVKGNEVHLFNQGFEEYLDWILKTDE